MELKKLKRSSKKNGKKSGRNQEGKGSRIQWEKFVLKRGRIFLKQGPLGEDRDTLRKGGEKVRMSLSDEILNKL